ncbi:sugar ABC transporter permease [Paenibacillus sp. N3.4]|uniref:ABC transporter permease n=1 Tax=Paenibacillus sp. N3.4 TaxID=2603222 RepID=UPI0011CBDDF3|nr:sugar ABC transporter permease [Paenibacillus sp. N3.4]
MNQIKGNLALQMSAAKPKKQCFWRQIRRNKWLYGMLAPGVLYFLLFKYAPMWGLLIAFKDYQPYLGFFGSKWVGIKHFERLFHDPSFWMLLRNTLVLAGYNIFFFFPAPILLSLIINEVRQEKFKRAIQTFIYVPHFISWVVVVGIAYTFFTIDGGLVNEAIMAMGGSKINFLASAGWFRTMITLEVIWKETGWGTIIFLAALAGVDPQIYEAAKIDGAGRLRQLWHVTLPAIRSTIIILFILRLGTFLDTGFEQIFLMLNPINREVGEVFDTYVYTAGITQGQFSFSTAVGLFKSVVGFVLVISSNWLAKKFGGEGVY